MVLSDLTPENFTNIWQIKWIWSCTIHFLSDIFGLLSFKNFASMAMWHNNFSSLFPGSLSFMACTCRMIVFVVLLELQRVKLGKLHKWQPWKCRKSKQEQTLQMRKLLAVTMLMKKMVEVWRQKEDQQNKKREHQLTCRRVIMIQSLQCVRKLNQLQHVLMRTHLWQLQRPSL